jgi:hypothetical protein
MSGREASLVEIVSATLRLPKRRWRRSRSWCYRRLALSKQTATPRSRISTRSGFYAAESSLLAAIFRSMIGVTAGFPIPQ